MKKMLLASMIVVAAMATTGCTQTTATNDTQETIVSITVEKNLKVVEATATADDGNVAENVLDGDLSTRWSSLTGESITLELVEGAAVSAVNIAFSKGNERRTKFMLDTSTDGENWETVYYGMSSGTTDQLEKYSFPKEDVKFIKITGFGNTSNQWNSITVVEAEGSGAESENPSSYTGVYEVSTSKEKAAAKLELENKNKRPVVPYVAPTSYVWEGDFSKNWQNEWDLMPDKNFGLEENIEYMEEDGVNFIRVHYPEGSISSGQHKSTGSPLGGAQFYKTTDMPAAKEYELSYKVRFSENFDFVKGGKLPGLYGGDRNASGQRIPDGKTGWSTRFMWRANGSGEVYTYMPSSKNHGSSLGRGDWKFETGVWHEIVQRVKLNTVGEEDGSVEVYLDGNLVHKSDDLIFRTVDTLKIDGLFFSTFFGGSDPSWASTADVYTDYADFKVAK